MFVFKQLFMFFKVHRCNYKTQQSYFQPEMNKIEAKFINLTYQPKVMNSKQKQVE